VLIGEVLTDEEKIDKLQVSFFARNRDFVQAIFDRSDLRKVDFSGSKLSGARFRFTRLEQAHLGCSNPAAVEYSTLECAELDGAHFEGAAMQGAVFDGAEARGAEFTGAELQGASLTNADFTAAGFWKAKLVAADLSNSRFLVVNFRLADLRGANLSGSDLSGAYLEDADLSGSSGTSVRLWRARADRLRTYLADFDKLDFDLGPWENKKSFEERSLNASDLYAQRRIKILTDYLDPTTETQPPFYDGALLNPQRLDAPVNKNPPATSLPAPRRLRAGRAAQAGRLRSEFLAELACRPEGAPFVARSLMRRTNLSEDLGSDIYEFARILKAGRAEPFSCLGTQSFDNKDWGMLQTLIRKTSTTVN
jgi:uncharacterized protein YjbI with pentapeptide repeats